MPGQSVLFGLWDLAAPNEEGLVAVAATQRLDDARSVELCGIVVRPGLRRRGLGWRLVTEVADALRAQGAAHLVVRLEGDPRPAAALLTRAGLAVNAGDLAVGGVESLATRRNGKSKAMRQGSQEC
jgi:GNAT superfamily N-acetyltransferase